MMIMRHVIGLSPPEIAERMGRSESSIHGLHHRGRRAAPAGAAPARLGPVHGRLRLRRHAEREPRRAGTWHATPVPFTRLDYADPALLEELLALVRGVAERGAFTLGEPVEAFEQEFAAYCETEFAVGVSSGTEALALALRALGDRPRRRGDRAVELVHRHRRGGERRRAPRRGWWTSTRSPTCSRPRSSQSNLTPSVRCVIPVHLFGATVEMDPILDARPRRGRARGRGRLPGARRPLPRPARRKRSARSAASASTRRRTSAPGATAGAVVTSEPELAERVRLLRAHGEKPRYHHRLIGAHRALDALQAAVLRRKLTRLDGWNDERRRLGQRLRAALAGSARRPAAGRSRRPRSPSRTPTTSITCSSCAASERDALREHLAECGVASAVHYPDADPPHRRLRAARAHGTGSLPE